MEGSRHRVHGILEKPSLYLSDFFEKNRGAYYDALTTVRTSDNLIHWIKFFLNAVIQTALKGQQTFRDILVLRNQTDGKIVSFISTSNNSLFSPKFTIRRIHNSIGCKIL